MGFIKHLLPICLLFVAFVSYSQCAPMDTKEQVYARINMERQKRGLPAVPIHKGLARTAQCWAMFMKYSLVHNMTFSKLYNRAATECITVGQDPVTNWMGSKSHRQAILSRGIKSMGVGFYRGKWVWRAFY